MELYFSIIFSFRKGKTKNLRKKSTAVQGMVKKMKKNSKKT